MTRCPAGESEHTRAGARKRLEPVSRQIHLADETLLQQHLVRQRRTVKTRMEFVRNRAAADLGAPRKRSA